MKRNNTQVYALPYYLWIGFFVIMPMLLLLYQSFFDYNGNFTFDNYRYYLTSVSYLKMTVNSFVMAFAITLVTFILAYPTAYLLAQTKRRELWMMMIILPTWINLLIKVYAFIGLLSRQGPFAHFLDIIGFEDPYILFTNFAFILVAVYVELPFMFLPIFNSIVEIPENLKEASRDLGATPWQILYRVILPLSARGIRSGVQAVFIPSLSLFMIARLIGGNRVITLGTAVEQHFLVTRNWGMGATIGVILMIVMMVVMYLTRDRKGVSEGGMNNGF